MLLLLPALASAACASSASPGAREVRVHQYVFGAFGGDAFDVRSLCASGEATSFELRRAASDYALSFASLGMYMPHRIRVRCTAGSAP